MKRSRILRRVSWAPGHNLCQVKLFRREDCPSKVGIENQDTLQDKPSWTVHSSCIRGNDLPPGFGGGHSVSGLKHHLAEMPRIQWACPPKFVLNSDWHVASAEESEEVEAQKLREMRVLEAVYPRRSAVPLGPYVSMDVEVEGYDDDRTPLIPLAPIEDKGADVSLDFAAQPKTASNSQAASMMVSSGLLVSGTQSMPHCPSSDAKSPVLDLLPGVSSDVVLAALGALTATVTKSEGQGSLIDTDLLIKMLSDPKLVEKLIHDPGHDLAVAANVHTSVPQTGITSLPVSSPMPSGRSSEHLSKEFQPTSSVSAPWPGIDSVSISREVVPSVPVSQMDINMTSGHQVPNGNAQYSTLNHLQPALSMMPVEPNSVQKVLPAVRSTAIQLNPAPAVAAMNPNTVKDANYLKNLIKEHGSEKQEAKGYNLSQTGSHFNHIQNLKLEHNLKPMALKTKSRKPCSFFNTSRGCRNGSNCPYMHHDKSFPSAKRMKFGGEIAGII